ncbi:MAG: hypothetical protein GX372_08805 [Ignavibacteria bacterium]|jgi:hypothetical protein|nr:hypothetical protein [Ignavibacteria bacterium]
MKKLTIFSLFTLLLIGLFFTACDSGPKPVEITKLKTYTDELLKFSIDYPENWVDSKMPGERFVVFSSNDAKSRFSKYDPTGFPGAIIDVYATKVTETKTVDTLIQKSKLFPDEYYKESTITVDGVQAKRLDYGFELEGGDFQGVYIIASKDNLTYTSLKIEAFDDTWEVYKDTFETIIKSLKLAETQQRRQDTITNIEELPFPSENLVAKKGNGFTISVPDNFYLGKAATEGVLSSNNYVGDRRADCNIMVDVLDGSKTSDFKKAATEVAARYTNSSALSNTKVGGVDAYMMTWRPTKDVKGRVYFAKKGDKIFRISINWYSPEEKEYLPIFEKSINSIKFD